MFNFCQGLGIHFSFSSLREGHFFLEQIPSPRHVLKAYLSIQLWAADQLFVVPRCARIRVHVARIVEILHTDFAFVIIDQIIKFQRIKVVLLGPLPSKLIS